MHIIYSYGGGEYLYYIFNFIAMLCSGGANGISSNIIRLVCVCGISWTLVLMYARNTLIPGISWLIWFMVASFLVVAPKGTVMIKDPITYGSVGKTIDNVPLLLAMGASSFSGIGHDITKKIESVFIVPGSPSYLKYIETGSLFGSKLIKKLKEVRIEDPAFNANLTRFVQQCVVYDAMIGHKYTLKKLRETENIWELVSSNASNVLGFLYKDKVNNENFNKILTCAEGAKLLNDKWNEVLGQTVSKEGLRLFGHQITAGQQDLSQSAKNAFLTKLPQSYQMFSGQSSNAVDILKQQMMIHMLREAPAKKAGQLGDSYTVAKATLQQRNTYQTAGLMAEESLVVMRAVFEALIYASFVFVYILLFLPAGYKILGYYFQAICWIQLWAPLYAILNFIMTLYGHYQSKGILGNLGLTRANSAALIDLHTDITALAGWLSLSVPYISFILVNRGGVSAFVQIASRLGSELGGTISGAAQDRTSGNISLGNFSQGNTSFQTMNAHKISRNFDYQSGQFSTNLESGMMKITNPEGSVYLGGVGKTTSTFSTDLTDSSNLSMQLSRHAQQEKSLMDSKSIDYSNQVANAQRDVADLLSRISNSDSNAATTAQDQSFSNNQTLQNVVDFSKKLQHKFGLSAGVALTAAMEIAKKFSSSRIPFTSIKLPSPKGILGGKLKLGGDYNYDSISDFAESEGFRENFDSIVKATQGLSFNQNQVKEKSLQQNIGSSYDESNSLRDSISAHYQRTERLNKAANLMQSSNYDTRTIRSQDLLHFIANSPASNAPGKIGYDTAASIIDATSGSLADRKQEFLESFQQARTKKAVEYFMNNDIKDGVDFENKYNDLFRQISDKKPIKDHSSVINKSQDIVFDETAQNHLNENFSNQQNSFNNKKQEFDKKESRKHPKEVPMDEQGLKAIQEQQMYNP